MKLQAKSSKELNKALRKSAKCMANKNALPILDNVLLSMNADGRFYFTTSTGDAQLSVPAPLTIFDGKFTAPVALPLGIITSFLAALPECTVTLVFDEKASTLKFEYCTEVGDKVKEGEVSVAYYDGKEYPLLKPATENCTHISLPMAVLNSVLAQAKDFIKIDDLRPVMNCLCIDIADDLSELNFVASDGNTLYRRTYSNDPAKGGSEFFRGGEACRILVSLLYFRTLSAFDGCDTVDIQTDGRTIYFSAPDVELTCRAIEGRYPNYRAVIPTGNPYYICVGKAEALAVCSRVSLFSDRSNNNIVLKKEGMFLNVSARDLDYSTAAEDQVLIADSECQDGFSIAFSVQKFITAMSAISADDVRIQMSEPNRAVVITANSPAPDTLTLCMPMLID